ncbi:zinc finger protein 346-like [Iris pallida]|uniref:Zinc finger protein 346-like n=1 Tax=Iris pallida TaxID=29817 RepID=A0AAX6HLK1_IRIPA|nr:zinc finger protein 346-like [Iris pallida]
MNKIGTTRTYTDLEMKKCKVIQGGASADSVRVCTICNVVCNSDKVFASHVAGEKHALKVLGISPMAIKPKIIAHLKALHSIKNQTQPTPTTAANKAPKGLVSFVQSAYCEVCKINCNSQEVLNNHKTGKKHMRNMQKLQTSMAPKPAKVPEKSEVQKDASVKAAAQQPKALPTKKDLETKKQKVLNGGAAADAVRVCGLCNVVCNSESVFASHIEGQKHMSKLNKQQAAPV